VQHILWPDGQGTATACSRLPFGTNLRTPRIAHPPATSDRARTIHRVLRRMLVRVKVSLPMTTIEVHQPFMCHVERGHGLAGLVGTENVKLRG